MANTLITASGPEIVIEIALSGNQGLNSATGRVRRFREQWAQLGIELKEFRRTHGMTQAEVARAVGAAGESTVCQWENGTNVPDGLRLDRLRKLLRNGY